MALAIQIEKPGFFIGINYDDKIPGKYYCNFNSINNTNYKIGSI